MSVTPDCSPDLPRTPIPTAAHCPACHHAIPREARFCTRCGANADLRQCPHCDAVNDRAANRCYKCAAVLRRPVAPGPKDPPAVAGGATPTIDLDASDLRAMRSLAASWPGGCVGDANPEAVPRMRAGISAHPLRRDASEHLQTRRGGAGTRRHEIGALTAPTDEAELTAPDPDVRGHGAWRHLVLGLAGFTLLVVPGLVAMTVLERNQPGRVETAVAWARDGVATWWPNGSTSPPSAPVAASATPPSITPTNDSVPVLVDHHASVPRRALEHEGAVRSTPEAYDRGRSAAVRIGPRIEAEATTEPSVASIRWTPRPTATRARLIPATDLEDRAAVSTGASHDRGDTADAFGP